MARPRSARNWSSSLAASGPNAAEVARMITPSGTLLKVIGATRSSRAVWATRSESMTTPPAGTCSSSGAPVRMTRRTWSFSASSPASRSPWLASGSSASSRTTSRAPNSAPVWSRSASSAALPSPSSSKWLDRTPLNARIAVSTAWLRASVVIRRLNAPALAPTSSSESTASAHEAGSQPVQSWLNTASASRPSTVVIRSASSRRRLATTRRASPKLTAPTARPARIVVR